MTSKSLEETRCLFVGRSVDRFDEYLDDHPDIVDDVKQGMEDLADGPRDLSKPIWEYMGHDLPDPSYIYQASEHVVLVYHIVSLAPICLLGLVAILDDRDF